MSTFCECTNSADVSWCKKWILALLCVIAEACLVWTLYGMGACLFVIVGMAVLGFIRSRVESRNVSEEPAGEEAAK